VAVTIHDLEATGTGAPDDLIHRITATPEGHSDPYRLYRQLRTVAPIHRSGLDGVWYVSGFDACREVLGDPRIGKNDQFIVPRHGVDPERVRLARRRRSRRSMITANPPEHTRLRGAAKGAFIPPAMNALRSRVAAIVAERLDRLAALGEADVMAELAFPMPVTVVGEMIGVPEEDRAWFRPLMRTLVSSDSFKRSPDELAEVERAGDELDAYFLELIARRRKEPADDLLSYFVAQADDGLLSEDELFSTVTLLFFAGFLTTTNLIGNGLTALFDHPAEQARLWAQPELAPAAVEEILRFDSPVQFVHRNVLEPFELDGHELAAGDVVLVLLAAANRDPARFAHPDRFDVGRPDNLHLAFAWGLHFCLGARLARMEGQLIFEGLVDRFARVEPAGEPVRNPGLAIRGFDALPVRFTPR
jgi:cytochrome P450